MANKITGRYKDITTRIDTKNISMTKNIAVWFDGTLRPAKGHNGNCRWLYDGQVFYHTHDAWLISVDKAWSWSWLHSK